MTNQELIFYIKEQLKAGIPAPLIKEVLVTRGGWRETDVDEGFRFIGVGGTKEAVSKPETPLPPPIPAQQPVVESVRPATLAQNVAAPVSVTVPIESPAVSQMSVYAPTQANEVPHFEGMQTPEHQQIIEITKKRASQKRMILVITILVLILGVGAFCTYAYMYYLNPTPERVFSKMISSMQKVKGLHYMTEAVTTLSLPSVNLGTTQMSGDKAEQTVTLKGEGTVDISDREHPTSESNFNLTTTLLPLNLSIATKSLNDIFYVQMPNMGAFTALVAPNLKSGDWLSFSKADLDQLALDTPAFKDRFHIDTAHVTDRITPEKRILLLKLFIESKAFAHTVSQPNEKLDGTIMHHYQWTLDKEALRAFLEQAIPLLSDMPLSNTDTQALTTFTHSFEITDGEIWIGMKDFLPHKIVFTLKAFNPESTNKISIASTTVAVAFSNFDKKLNIIAPANASSYYTLFRDARLKGKDAQLKAQLASARALAEIYYSSKKSYSGMCLSTDASISSMMSSVNTLISPDTLSCVDAKSTYRLYAHLLTNPAHYFCVDSTGSAVELESSPISSTLCN